MRKKLVIKYNLTPYKLRVQLKKDGIKGYDELLKKWNKKYQKLKQIKPTNFKERQSKIRRINYLFKKVSQLMADIDFKAEFLDDEHSLKIGRLLYEHIGEVNIDMIMEGSYSGSLKDMILNFAKYYTNGNVEFMIECFKKYLNSITKK